MLRVKEPFVAMGRVYDVGETVDASDPVVNGRALFFEADESGPVVEQATAAPGEKRTTTRARKPKADTGTTEV